MPDDKTTKLLFSVAGLALVSYGLYRSSEDIAAYITAMQLRLRYEKMVASSKSLALIAYSSLKNRGSLPINQAIEDIEGQRNKFLKLLADMLDGKKLLKPCSLNLSNCYLMNSDIALFSALLKFNKSFSENIRNLRLTGNQISHIESLPLPNLTRLEVDPGTILPPSVEAMAQLKILAKAAASAAVSRRKLKV